MICTGILPHTEKYTVDIYVYDALNLAPICFFFEGEIVSVSDTPYDFRKPCVIGARIAPLQSSLKKGYDDVLCLDCRGEMMICGRYILL